MAVIINDFEIAVEAEPTASADEGVAPSEPGGPPPHPTPQEIVAVVRWSEERHARVDAT